MMTYGDGVANVNIADLLRFHRDHGKLATITAVQPPGRFGAIAFDGDGDIVQNFQEKPKGDGAWINGGFFVLEPQALDYITGDDILWEKQPLAELSRDGQLVAYRHAGFWKPMDTLRDKSELEEQWNTGTAPWKVW
jgi:glucose-1-phosphate cytidylyltransferase